MPEVTKNYPNDSVQFYVEPWWIKATDNVPARGRLIWAYLPHVTQQANLLVSEGREEDTQHDTARFSFVPLQMGNVPPAARLPVAGLPTYPNEVRFVLRAKRRPAIILGTGGAEVPKELRVGAARHQTSPLLAVVPAYGVDKDSPRGGWNPTFVQRIRRAEYPQYLWDSLPLPGAKESILRLDHLQPLGAHGDNFELTPFQLSADALAVVDEWYSWLLTGRMAAEGILCTIREDLGVG